MPSRQPHEHSPLVEAIAQLSIDCGQTRPRTILADGSQDAAGERPLFEDDAQRVQRQLRRRSAIAGSDLDEMPPELAGLALAAGKPQDRKVPGIEIGRTSRSGDGAVA